MPEKLVSVSENMAREKYLSSQKEEEYQDRGSMSLRERFGQLQGDQKKGKEMIPGQEDNMIRISISHKFKKKDEVAWMSVSFTREEVLKNDPVIGDIKVKVISLVEEYKKNFDDAMDMAEPFVTQPTQVEPQKAKAESASGDDKACPKCGSKMNWIRKPYRDGRKDNEGNALMWGAHGCPNTSPKIDISERCTQELIFPSRNR